MFQKALSGPVQKRPPQARAASHDLDERTILEGSNHSRRTDATNVLHLDAPDRLSVGDDGERLQSWSREPGRPGNGVESLEVGCEVRPCEKLVTLTEFSDLERPFGFRVHSVEFLDGLLDQIFIERIVGAGDLLRL